MKKNVLLFVVIAVLVLLTVTTYGVNYYKKTNTTSCEQDTVITETTIAETTEEPNDDDNSSESSVYNERETVLDYSEVIERSEFSIDIPILGELLETTGEIVRQYYCDGSLLAAVALKDGELSQDFSKYNPLNNNICLSVTKRCLSDFPDYQIVGYIYIKNGYSTIFPVVFNNYENKIQYCRGSEIVDFKMIDSCDSLEAAQKAFVVYLEKKNQIKLEIPVFPWETADNNYNYSYINKYLRQDMWSDEKLLNELPETDFVDQYDSYIALPLLNKDKEEGKYVGYLIYWKNNLIAEFVLEVDKETYSGVFLSCSAYNANEKTFEPISNSYYLSAIQSSGKTPSCVIWDNGVFRVE